MDDGLRISEERTIKRRKLSNDDDNDDASLSSSSPTAPSGRSVTGSRMFSFHRQIGLVSPTSVPFVSLPLGKSTFQITTSTGNGLQTYDLRRGLQLVFVTSPPTPHPITASTVLRGQVLAAWAGDGSSGVWIYSRGKKEAALECPPHWSEAIRGFCVFGSWIVGVGETGILVWKSTTLELYTVLQNSSPVPFTACIASVPTLLNKVVVGRHDGSVEIWNVSSGKLVYTILSPLASFGSVTAIQPAPALCLVAIAFEKGPLLIHDVRADQTVLRLSNPSEVPVDSISFRTDGLGAGDEGRLPGVMATASTASGDISLWDLNHGGRKAGVLRAAHSHPKLNIPGGISKVEFLPGQAVLVSGGLDNSLRTWIFDETPFSPLPRLLHSRSGHNGAVTRLLFLPTASDGSDDTGKWLMAASTDRSLWGWSLRRDGQSTELSQGAIRSKAAKQGLLSGDSSESIQDLRCPPVTRIACSLNRDGGIGALPGKLAIWQNSKGKHNAEVSTMTGWESVVTAHENDSRARTWFWGRKRAGRWAFETQDGATVSTVAISPCGTFALVGSKKGAVDMFNLQSGIHRQSFPVKLTPSQAKNLKIRRALLEEGQGKDTFSHGQGKHTGPVVGLAVDNLNSLVITAGAEGRVKFWDFGSGLLQSQLDWSTSTSLLSMQHHRGSDLIALACTDGTVRVVDINTCKLIRELTPARSPLGPLKDAPISDLSFSPDGRWIAACIDHLVLLWDLPSGHLIDAFKVFHKVLSIAFSPTGEFLATSSESTVGIQIWTNRSVFANISTRHIEARELEAIATGTGLASNKMAFGEENLADGGGQVDNGTTQDTGPEQVVSLESLSSDLLSLSLVPRSRWQNLLHLDIIRQRNKPTEPPKKPEKAPFFLPSLQDSRDPSSTNDIADRTHGRNLVLPREQNQGIVERLLQESSSSNDFGPVIDHFLQLAPAAADVEIRSLSFENDEACLFIKALVWLLLSRSNYEVGQAWMSVFLRVHGDTVLERDDLRSAVKEWRDLLDSEKQRVQRLSGYVGGMVGWLRAARV